MQKNILTFKSLKEKRPVKVLQFGAGNFLRGFCDWMIDVLNEKTDFNGNVQIVQPLRKGKGIDLASQEGLFHVTLNDKPRLITCVDSIVDPFLNYQEFLDLASNPDLEFVISNSTEAGIVFNENDDHNFPANATAFLYRRYQLNPERGLCFLPCELIERNGEALKAVVHRYADLWRLPEDFRSWVDSNNIFCNTLVDRIVPGFKDIGYNDKFAVMAEPFHLWVIEAPEDVQRKLPFEKAGLNVKFVKDLTPYRTRKVRILNGAHTTIVPVAYLKGLRTVRESVEDKEVGGYLRETIHEEIIPTLDLPQAELVQFADDVMERFRNPFIKHELSSIALNSVSKFKVRVLPSILKYIEIRKELPKRLLYSLAALIKFYKGEGRPVNDTPAVMEFFRAAWAGNDPSYATQIALKNADLWGLDLTNVEGLQKQVTEDVKMIDLNY